MFQWVIPTILGSDYLSDYSRYNKLGWKKMVNCGTIDRLIRVFALDNVMYSRSEADFKKRASTHLDAIIKTVIGIQGVLQANNTPCSESDVYEMFGYKGYNDVIQRYMSLSKQYAEQPLGVVLETPITADNMVLE